jgi:molecular chaperone IbpA
MTYNLPNVYNAFSVGFDESIKRLEQFSKTAKSLGYPPYNIIKSDENKYVIELAVAGFGKQDIELQLNENTLTITGKIDSDNSTDYIYKGIADRGFARKFNLADTVEIKNAQLINGMLKIWLENIIPDHKKPRKIEIEEKDVKDQIVDQKDVKES